MAYPNIKAELARAGMTADELAQTVGVSSNTMSNWMVGKTKPDIEQAKAIADKLGFTIDYLFESA